jgi:hypothetical protein
MRLIDQIDASCFRNNSLNNPRHNGFLKHAEYKFPQRVYIYNYKLYFLSTHWHSYYCISSKFFVLVFIKFKTAFI